MLQKNDDENQKQYYYDNNDYYNKNNKEQTIKTFDKYYTLRFWAKIVIYLTLSIMLFGAISYFYDFFKYASSKSSENTQLQNTIFFSNTNDLFSTKIVLFIFIIFSIIKSLIFSIKLIKNLNNLSDEELEKNKWILAYFSLSLGGILVPILFSRIISENNKSTFYSKKIIGKYYSIVGLIASIATIGMILVSYFVLPKGNITNTTSKNEIIIFSSLTIIALLSSITTLIFTNKDLNYHLESKTSLGKIANFISYIFLIIATIELIIRMLVAIVRIIEAFRNIFASRNFLVQMLEVIISGFIITSMVYLIIVIWSVIKGLWKGQNTPLGQVQNYKLKRRPINARRRVL